MPTIVVETDVPITVSVQPDPQTVTVFGDPVVRCPVNQLQAYADVNTIDAGGGTGRGSYANRIRCHRDRARDPASFDNASSIGDARGIDYSRSIGDSRSLRHARSISDARGIDYSRSIGDSRGLRHARGVGDS